MVSVVLPTYNRGSFIFKSIESVLNQTFIDWELIIVDDSSTDNTEDIVRSFSDDRIKYFKLSFNSGANVARNFGINRAKGEYITFLDSDDEYYPDKLSKQVQLLTSLSSDYLIIGCGRKEFTNNQLTSQSIPKFRGCIYNHCLAKLSVGSGTPYLMVRNSVFNVHKIFFDDNMPATQDWDFFTRVCKKGKFDFVEDYLVKVNHHGGERVWNYDRVLIAFEIQYNKYLHDLKLRPRVSNLFLTRWLKICFANNSLKKAKEVFDLYNKKVNPFRWFIIYAIITKNRIVGTSKLDMILIDIVHKAAKL